MTIRGNNNRF